MWGCRKKKGSGRKDPEAKSNFGTFYTKPTKFHQYSKINATHES